MTDVIGFGYAAFVAVGGLVGYMKAGSLVSLVMGLAMGGLAAFGASQTSRNPSNCLAILGASAILLFVMGMRFMNTGKFMPAGMLAALSLFMVVRYGTRLM
ncbi:transmembrane protein 14C-like [Asterias amurensis]|uniref:transmembrane protein 14C-like n=1 Tax=Asterias amurensis TaxID=7602 RepID=UPI003AB37632